MCGIAGYVSTTGRPEAASVRRMCDQIRHRGPDDEGIYTDEFCALGMRRLSIIDLSTGHQPMCNEDGTVWVVFNGEIYNYQGLREELLGQGHLFTTNSDTEVLIHLYEQEGTGGISRLRGMFSFAIWDRRAKRLLMARDPFGKKPLYYAGVARGFYFASELKSLRAVGVPQEIDTEAIKLYLQFGYIPEPWSCYRAVRKLRPGHWMTVDLSGQQRQGRYWELPHPQETERPDLSVESSCEEIRRVFDESVRLRMIADVPLGAFLSGGIDSSLVVASMARQSSQPVRTFSIGFEEEEYSELPYARLIAKHYKTDHHELIVRPDAISLIEKLIGYFDEPFADNSAIPTYLVSQFAARHVKVALSGDGGDETFAGYHSFFEADHERRYDAIPQWMRRMIRVAGDLLPYSAYGKNFLRNMSRRSSLERVVELTGFNTYYLRKRVLKPEWLLPTSVEFLKEAFDGAILDDSHDCLSQAIYFEATAKLAGDILVKVDRMSMANSLEVRCPMLDVRLAEMAMRIPNHWKTRDGKGKLILLQALGEYLPAELLNRPKRGFSPPLSAWLRGPLRDFIGDSLTSRTFLNRGFVSAHRMQSLLEEHWSGRRNNVLFLWQLLVLELWLAGQESPAPQIAGSGS